MDDQMERCDSLVLGLKEGLKARGLELRAITIGTACKPGEYFDLGEYFEAVKEVKESKAEDTIVVCSTEEAERIYYPFLDVEWKIFSDRPTIGLEGDPQNRAKAMELLGWQPVGKKKGEA
jgi:hypothetical protein